MATKGIREAILTVNNGSVIVYFHRESTMRLPTGVTISKKKSKSGKFLDWDDRRRSLTPEVEDFEASNEVIQNALKNANEILKEHARNDIFLTGAELEELIIQKKSEKKLVRSALFLDMYRQFHEEKKSDLEVNGNILSLKDYTSFQNVIIDYEAVHNQKIKILDVNVNFCKKLHNWLKTKSPTSVNTAGGIHLLKTKGNLKPKTLKKRFDTFKEFFKYLQANGFIHGYDFLKEFASKIQNTTTQKVTLSVDEIFQLYDYRFDHPRLEHIRQLFIFACLTGMRWGDLVSFDPKFISNTDSHPVYKRLAQKTAKSSGAIIELPLCQEAMEILRTNGMSLKPLLTSNVQANRELKEALKETGWFDEITSIVDKETGECQRRYEAISMHKGRDSFITNLVTVTPLNELMKYTGHTKLSTLQKYIDQTRKVNPTFINSTFKRNSDAQV